MRKQQVSSYAVHHKDTAIKSQNAHAILSWHIYT
jgi:hypothetical protein